MTKRQIRNTKRKIEQTGCSFKKVAASYDIHPWILLKYFKRVKDLNLEG